MNTLFRTRMFFRRETPFFFRRETPFSIHRMLELLSFRVKLKEQISSYFRRETPFRRVTPFRREAPFNTLKVCKVLSLGMAGSSVQSTAGAGFPAGTLLEVGWRGVERCVLSAVSVVNDAISSPSHFNLFFKRM